MSEYKRQSHVGLFVVSTIRYETPDDMRIRVCETMIFRASEDSTQEVPKVEEFIELYAQQHDWTADLDTEHERIVKLVGDGLIALRAT